MTSCTTALKKIKFCSDNVFKLGRRNALHKYRIKYFTRELDVQVYYKQPFYWYYNFRDDVFRFSYR